MSGVAFHVTAHLLLVVDGCCCGGGGVALWRGLFMSFSSNQNHDLAGACHSFRFFFFKKKKKRVKEMQQHDVGPLMCVFDKTPPAAYSSNPRDRSLVARTRRIGIPDNSACVGVVCFCRPVLVLEVVPAAWANRPDGSTWSCDHGGVSEHPAR